MPPLLPAGLLLLAVLAAAGGLVAIRRSGAEQAIARRLAGARQVRLSELFSMKELPAPDRSASPAASGARTPS